MPMRLAQSAPPPLADLVRGGVVGVVGGLLHLSHEQFRDLVEAQNGVMAHDAAIDELTILVIGEANLPLEPDGQLPKRLRDAVQRETREPTSFAISSESEFLEEVVNEGRIERLYTTAALAELREIPASRIETWVRAGLIEPVKTLHGLHRFEFRQVAAVQTIAELAQAGVTVGKIRKSLQQL